MSDLQIVTGLSILISGFAQLRCGLSAYHWQVLVYLAWFSSLTHLCCLTFLRNYLFNHPGQRLWRLVSMFIIVVMLVVALVPTGYLDWLYLSWKDISQSPASSPAICFYGKQSLPPDLGSNSYLSMIISSLLLLLGYITRVIKLHKMLSIDFILVIRSFLSRIARKGLRRVHAWCRVQANPRSLRRSLIYHPLLGVFLMLRVSLDIYSSMLMEVSNPSACSLCISWFFLCSCILIGFQVWWLLMGFAWGMIHLVLVLKLGPGGAGSSDWTFGQVIPIVLLATPAITLVEFLYEGEVDHLVDNVILICYSKRQRG